jgi:hypothetical protein
MSKNLLKFLFLLVTAISIFAQKKTPSIRFEKNFLYYSSIKICPSIKTADSLYMAAQPTEKVKA